MGGLVLKQVDMLLMMPIFATVIFLGRYSKSNKIVKDEQAIIKIRDNAEIIDAEQRIAETNRAVDYKKDLGNLEVYIGGEVIVAKDRIIVKGESNLLPGATIISFGHWDTGSPMAIAAYQQHTTVQEDGTFYFEYDHYESDVAVTLRLAVNGENANHYGINLENVTGPQVYKTERIGKYHVQTSFITDITKKTIPLEIPDWSNKPSDYGEPNVWMDVEVTSDHKYLYFSGKSNLVEGSMVGGHLKNSHGRLVPFSFDYVYVNPDGSFMMRVPYTDLRPGMYMPITFELDSNSWENVIDAYGEKGEKLEGKLIKFAGDYQYIKKVVNIDVPKLKIPEEVDLTLDDTEIKIQITDDILFDFDDSVLKSSAKETLIKIIDELEALPVGTIVHINGHTDNVGNPTYNIDLSEKRAESVLQYINKYGIVDHLKISTYGFGEREPRFPNNSELERAQNRRVEIVVNPE